MKFRKKRGQNEAVFDLNIIPIVDCLTILVIYMLAAGVYYSIALLDVGVATAGTDVTSTKGRSLEVKVSMRTRGRILLSLSGKARQTIQIAPVKGAWNYQGLQAELTRIKEKWPKTQSATLQAGSQTPYREVVAAMEVLRKSHPDVVLGGF